MPRFNPINYRENVTLKEEIMKQLTVVALILTMIIWLSPAVLAKKSKKAPAAEQGKLKAETLCRS